MSRASPSLRHSRETSPCVRPLEHVTLEARPAVSGQGECGIEFALHRNAARFAGSDHRRSTLLARHLEIEALGAQD
ncbi:hypothetical protein [Natronobeatus ordinarius]|uniref:hypothetical protein n=1 Tax=Natronobeatus ordinarius TaxID=2963433 RepID=UPI0020CE90B6|nr:hypothetical protein [Natronobeatus ordinarius]